MLYYKRLEQDRFHPRIFLRQDSGLRSIRLDELVLLMEGISSKVARRYRYNPERKNVLKASKNKERTWLFR
ncbi:MAG: transposase [Phocaeicola sp.]|nr:transposase [Phocaeicola sp.]MDE6181346.1 transposase [Phocaeicola sp.]